MLRYIYSVIKLKNGSKMQGLPYKRLRKSPYGKPCIIYNKRGYEIKNGIIDVKEKGFNELDCLSFWYKSDYENGIYDLLSELKNIDNYKFFTEESFQKFEPPTKKNKKSIYVLVKLPNYGEQFLPLRKSLNNKACVVFEGKGYDILNQYESIKESECTDYIFEADIKKGSVLASLVLKNFKYRIKPLLKRDMPVPADTAKKTKKLNKPKLIILSGKFK